jgi:serpin B
VIYRFAWDTPRETINQFECAQHLLYKEILMKRLVLLIGFVLLPLACSRTTEEPARVPKAVMLLDAGTIADVPNVPAADQTSLVAGNDEFAVDLYRQLSREPGNLFFSPYSISSTLAMSYAGAHGTTAAEMAKVLHFDLAADKLHGAFADLNQQLLGSQRGYQLSLANALWAQTGYAFEPAYVKRLKDSYGAGLGTVDFASNPEMARQAINSWVSEQTRGKIPELLQATDLNPLTRCVLTNAIYFQATWFYPFQKAATRNKTFWRTRQEQTQVPMMHLHEHLAYMEAEGVQALELPYESRFRLIVLLPRQRDGLAAMEKDLTAKKLRTWIGAMKREEVDVALPRFKVQSTHSLREPLTALGMSLAFSPDADFSGSRASAQQDGLKITAVIHQALVEVDEKGTEAAAATAEVKSAKSLEPWRHEPKQFLADHPFLFLIRDGQTGSILFLGRLTDPREK